MHIMMGPSAVLWRNADRANGSVRASAGFTRTKAPAHPESYGLFFGGRALDGEGQQYTYLMVRGDGKFLVSRRKGADVESLSGGWTAHAAVNEADENGKVTDRLEIDATTPGTVKFLVNGQAVHEAPMTAADANGIVGLRVNHNLDLHVEGPEVVSGSQASGR